MPDETTPPDSENDAKKSDKNTEKEIIANRFAVKPEEHRTKNHKKASRDHPKPSCPIWFLRFLWRRRKWRRKRRTERPGPNWAERTTIIITGGILIVACIQAYIYWEQAQIMQTSLNQNERSIILGSGQLAVAGRNAKTAEDTLKDSQKSFVINQRPYLVMDGQPQFITTPVADAQIAANATIRNIGKTPAFNYVLDIDLVKFAPGPKTPGGLKKFINFITSAFADLRKRDVIGRKERIKIGAEWAEQDLAPNATFFSTTANAVTLSADEFSALKTSGKVTLFYVGLITYSDSFGGNYETEFCSYFWGDNPNIWHVCDSHNTIR